jgi:hypothetical protein
MKFLAEQPGVTEVAVAGVPDARRGEVPVADVAGASTPGRWPRRAGGTWLPLRFYVGSFRWRSCRGTASR